MSPKAPPFRRKRKCGSAISRLGHFIPRQLFRGGDPSFTNISTVAFMPQIPVILADCGKVSRKFPSSYPCANPNMASWGVLADLESHNRRVPLRIEPHPVHLLYVLSHTESPGFFSELYVHAPTQSARHGSYHSVSFALEKACQTYAHLRR